MFTLHADKKTKVNLVHIVPKYLCYLSSCTCGFVHTNWNRTHSNRLL